MVSDNALYLSADEYDYHSIKKIALTNGYLGEIKIFDAKDENSKNGYIVTFKDCPVSIDDSIIKFKGLLENIRNNRFTR